jgi:hypothetical protein
MVRQGRALEALIKRLEAVAARGGAEIESPAMVQGRNSESPREIDVAVRSRVGSTDVFVMFECRDRSSVQDVTWIEQIASKRDDVGASVAVAVSTRGFTKGAKNVAARHGIELRTVDEITIADVVSWCGLQHLGVHTVESRAATFSLATFSDMPELAQMLPFMRLDNLNHVPIDVPIFTLWDVRNNRVPRNVEWLTAKQLFDFAFNAFTHQSEFDLAQLTDWQEVRIKVSTEETPMVAVKTIQGLFPLAHFYVFAHVRTVTSQVPVALREVTDGQGRKTQIAEAVVHVDDEQLTVSLVKSDDELAVLTESSAPTLDAVE